MGGYVRLCVLNIIPPHGSGSAAAGAACRAPCPRPRPPPPRPTHTPMQMYAQAAYCLEEVLLHQPTSLAHHLLLADTLYTLGGAQNWRTARAYYSGGWVGGLGVGGRRAGGGCRVGVGARVRGQKRACGRCTRAAGTRGRLSAPPPRPSRAQP